MNQVKKKCNLTRIFAISYTNILSEGRFLFALEVKGCCNNKPLLRICYTTLTPCGWFIIMQSIHPDYQEYEWVKCKTCGENILILNTHSEWKTDAGNWSSSTLNLILIPAQTQVYMFYSAEHRTKSISDFHYNSDLCGIQPWSVCPKLTSDCPSPADMLYFSFHIEHSGIKNEQLLLQRYLLPK